MVKSATIADQYGRPDVSIVGVNAQILKHLLTIDQPHVSGLFVAPMQAHVSWISGDRNAGQ